MLIAQLLKPTFCFPPPPFSQNIIFFWTSSLPPKNKSQMQTQIRRLFSDDKQKTDKMTCIFSSGDDYKSDTLLTPCWHLVDTLLVIFSNVQLYNCDNLTFLCNAFLPLPNVSMQSGFSPVAMTKYFPLTSLMFTAIVELSISTLIFVKKVWELELNLTNHFHTSIWW